MGVRRWTPAGRGPVLVVSGLVVALVVVSGVERLRPVLAFALAGALAGAGARVLLARLRRGTRVRPPWCEVAVATVWAVTCAAWVSGVLPALWVAPLLGLGWLGVAAGTVDVLHHRLPDALTLPALPVALLLLAPQGPEVVLRGTAGAGVAVAAHAAAHLLAPRGLGMGDVKLAAPLGAVLAAAAWPALVLATGLAALLTGLTAAAGVVSGRLGQGAALPHGPSMLLAGWLVTAGAAVTVGAG